MRILSDVELDMVLGGQDQIGAIKLSSVNVNATYSANPYESFAVSASDFGPVPDNEGVSNAPCYASYFHVLADLPSFSSMRCLAQATEYPNFELTGSPLIALNAYMSSSTDANGNSNPSLSNANVQQNVFPSGYNPVSGQYTSGANYSDVVLTAYAFTALTVPVPYINVETGASETYTQGMSANEHMVFVLGHEAAHEHGVTSETEANGFGVYAVQVYDTLPPGICP